jgi:hypothetical protein
MKIALALFLILALTACEDSSDQSRGSVEIGRYRFIAAADGRPDLILDTATGCLERLSVGKEDQDFVVQKAEVDFGGLGKDRACSASGITAIREGAEK